MAGAQWLGWAPPHRQLPGQFEGLGQLMQGLAGYQQNQLFNQDTTALQRLDPGTQFNPQSRQMQQMQGQGLLQALMQAQAPITPYQQAGLDIQRKQLKQQKRANRYARLKEERGKPETIAYFDKSGKPQYATVDNFTRPNFYQFLDATGGTIRDPVEKARKAESEKRAQRTDLRAEDKAQHDIEDRERAIAREQIDEYRKQQEEFRAERADLRAEDTGSIPKGQMIGDEWHEWHDGKLMPTGIKASPRFQAIDVGEKKAIFDPSAGKITSTGLPSGRGPVHSPHYKAQILGQLKSGSPSSALGIPLETLTTAEDHKKFALKSFGPKWKTLVPEAVDIINEKFPGAVPPPAVDKVPALSKHWNSLPPDIQNTVLGKLAAGNSGKVIIDALKKDGHIK